MKALIFNSGLGKRMGEYTKDRPKAMVQLKNGESIFERQVRILSDCGITEIIVTTGPYSDLLKSVAEKYPNLSFTFVDNERYAETNCIYSFYKASSYLKGDFITLHGDLVFSKNTLKHIMDSPYPTCVTVDKSKPLPEKDFKGRISNGIITQISVKVFGEDCISLQPMYKISSEDMATWTSEVIRYVESGNVNVYAEEAFNSISNKIAMYPVDCEGYFVEEIDNPEDYDRVSRDIAWIDAEEQTVLRNIDELKRYLSQKKIKKPLIVASKRAIDTSVFKAISEVTKTTVFSGFSPNPQYFEAIEGKNYFINNHCDSIISIGGGSAMDMAKCILVFSSLPEGDYLHTKHIFKNIDHIAIPTTAGTGSESTRYATLYRDGVKYSVAGEEEIPTAIVLIPDLISSAPDSVKIPTYLDALCQCIESIWSVNSNKRSIELASEGVRLLHSVRERYFKSDYSALDDIQKGANLSGKAINITQTTAAHALSYSLTSRRGIPHGTAVTMCIIPLWDLLIKNKICDDALIIIDKLFGCNNPNDTLDLFKNIAKKLLGDTKLNLSEEDIQFCCKSVNVQRLSNFPMKLTENQIEKIYREL